MLVVCLLKQEHTFMLFCETRTNWYIPGPIDSVKEKRLRDEKVSLPHPCRCAGGYHCDHSLPVFLLHLYPRYRCRPSIPLRNLLRCIPSDHYNLLLFRLRQTEPNPHRRVAPPPRRAEGNQQFGISGNKPAFFRIRLPCFLRFFPSVWRPRCARENTALRFPEPAALNFTRILLPGESLPIRLNKSVYALGPFFTV